MTAAWRFLLLVYNLLLLVLAVVILAVCTGRPEPLTYLQGVFSTPQNRVIAGVVAIVLLVIAVFMLINILKPEARNKSVVIESSLQGEITITIPAIKVIIMKAVRKVEGIREVKPVIKTGPQGLVIYLHIMINPEHNVPEMSRNVQAVVKEHLENIGGLQVAEIKVLIDDFANRPATT